ncbi:MAG: hypothetical protein ACU84J_12685 [Gammaproteobacteria bacterium]
MNKHRSPHDHSLSPYVWNRRTPSSAVCARAVLLACLSMATLFGVTACATYGDKVAPVPLPSSFSEHMEIRGALLAATSYVDDGKAEAAFGFDIRAAGLLPVRLVIDNQSGMGLGIEPQQTFLIDRKGQAWPLLTREQAFKRVKDEVEIGETFKGAIKPSLMFGAAGAVAGFAVGVLTGDIGEAVAKGAALGAGAGALYGGVSRQKEYGSEISKGLMRNALRNERVKPGELAYGYLFFPGRDEAESAAALRLGLSIGNEQHIVTVPLFESFDR